MYPLLFEIGPFSVHSLWFFAIAGMVFGSAAFVKLSRRYRLKLEVFSEHGIIFIISSLVVSRFAYFLFHISDFPTFFSFFRIWDRGLSFWGALLGFSAALFVLTKYSEETFWKITDVLVTPLLLGLLFGHFGAFLDGIGHGEATDLPWGITFQSAAVKYAVPVHPTQLYAFAYTLVLFIFLWKNQRSWIFKAEGFTTKIAVWSYSLFHFLEEFFRGDDTLTLFEFLRVSQVLALTVFLALTTILFKHDENFFQRAAQKMFAALKRKRSDDLPL